MKIPRKLRIGPHVFQVRSGKETDRLLCADDARGDCVSDDHVIRVSTQRPHTAVAETLLHESLHACWDVCGLRALGDEHEEQIITSMAPILLGMLRDNPELVSFLVR